MKKEARIQHISDIKTEIKVPCGVVPANGGELGLLLHLLSKDLQLLLERLFVVVGVDVVVVWHHR